MFFRVLLSLLVMAIFAVLIAFTPDSSTTKSSAASQPSEEPVQRGLKTE